MLPRKTNSLNLTALIAVVVLVLVPFPHSLDAAVQQPAGEGNCLVPALRPILEHLANRLPIDIFIADSQLQDENNRNANLVAALIECDNRPDPEEADRCAESVERQIDTSNALITMMQGELDDLNEQLSTVNTMLSWNDCTMSG